MGLRRCGGRVVSVSSFYSSDPSSDPAEVNICFCKTVFWKERK